MTAVTIGRQPCASPRVRSSRWRQPDPLRERDPHITRALGALVDVVLAVDDGVSCVEADCDVPLCCGPGATAPVSGLSGLETRA